MAKLFADRPIADPTLTFELALRDMGQRYAYAAGELGSKAATSLVRSDTLFDRMAAAIIDELISRGVPEAWIFEKTKATLSGLVTDINQDIVVRAYGQQPILSISLKSQMSSFGNNRKNFIHNLMGEVGDLHAGQRDLVCGLLYVLPTMGFETADARVRERPAIEAYLREWARWPERSSPHQEGVLYEAKALLITDFESRAPSGEMLPYICRDNADLMAVAGVPGRADGQLTGELAGIDLRDFGLDGFFDRLFADIDLRFN